MRIAITGATGNVGTSAIAALLEEPQVTQVVAIARRAPALALPKVAFVAADVSNDDLGRWFEGCEVVIHLAWQISQSHDRAKLWQNNVEGSTRVLAAAARAGVRALVVASSVGVYSPGPRDRLVDEGWPTEGVVTSQYSLQKVAVERELDMVEARFPGLRVVRMRPALIFKRDAASAIQRIFLGRLFPRWFLKPGRVPFVPERLTLQCVHSLDVGNAFRRAALLDVRGAFNLATDPVLDGNALADVLATRTAKVPPKLIRDISSTAFRLRLQPSEPGWVDLAFSSPTMSSLRARDELGWYPRFGAIETLLELLEGIRDGAGTDTPALAPRSKRARKRALDKRGFGEHVVLSPKP
jgi:nucleoside-diphosphate-sugar epimerase